MGHTDNQHRTVVRRMNARSCGGETLTPSPIINTDPTFWYAQQEYSEEVEKNTLIQKVTGFVRELGDPASLEAYTRCDLKTSSWPLIETDKYRHYYREFLQGLGRPGPLPLEDLVSNQQNART